MTARFCFGHGGVLDKESRGRGGTVDARDLKSLGVTPVPVRVRPPAPAVIVAQANGANVTKLRA